MSKPFAYPWDRTKPFKFYPVAVQLLRVAAPILFKIRVIGRENLPESASGKIMVCNHLHSIDPAFLMVATRLRWRFIAKIELFKNKFVAIVFTHANGFPVDRDIVDRRALDFALSVMEDGRCGLGIFPEGQRSADGSPQEAKAGAAMIARKTKADILPCSLYHEGLKIGFRTKVTVRIGKLIPYEELGLTDTPNKRQSREACEKIMGAIRELWEMKHE